MFFHNESVNNNIWMGNGMIFCAYVLCVYLIASCKNTIQRGFELFIPLSAATTIVIFNPVFYHFACGFITDKEGINSIYTRLGATLFILPVLSVGSVLFLKKMRNDVLGIRYAFVIIMIVLISLAGVNDNYKAYDVSLNRFYKTDDEVLDICDYILRTEDGQTQLYVVKEPEIVGRVKKNSEDTDNKEDDSLYLDLIHRIPEYTSRIRVVSDTRKKANVAGYDYVTVPKSGKDGISNMDFEVVLETDHLKLYHRKGGWHSD